ncbi:MAG: arylsulfatase [Pirellulales bacterium]|nr:arylsulfatase [Pirellulales bacterium]
MLHYSRDIVPRYSHLPAHLLHMLTAFVLATCILCFSANTVKCAEITQKRDAPNILMILTDDQGYGDIRSHGNDQIDTPVLDRLAADGARFDRFYVSPVCAPTRAALLTGRYHPRCGVHGVTRGYENMRAEEVTLAEVLKRSGYATGAFGKWHNGRHWPLDPQGQGFDEFLGFCGGHWNRYFDAELEHKGRPIKTKGYITDVLTDAAIRFMDEHKDGPFFCYVPYNTPHSPWIVSEKGFKKYKARGLDDKAACAYAMCENIDRNVGRLLSKLDELGLAENTIVFYMSDNGANSDRYNAGMKGRKGSLHEGGTRVPLFVRWPGHVKPGTVVRPIAAHIDILPTIVELCGLPKPETLPLDGVSLVPLLCGGKAEDWPQRMLFTHQIRGRGLELRLGAVRSQQWRAVHYGKNWLLYDMQSDPGQKKDVAKLFPQVLKKHVEAFDASFDDVTHNGFEPVAIPLAKSHRPWIEIPGNEALLVPDIGKGIRYHGPRGFANDWITGWTDTKAYPSWPLKVVDPGQYKVTLLYCCKPENVGAKLRVQIGKSHLDGTVTKAHDPAIIPAHECADPMSHYDNKLWAQLPMGRIEVGRDAKQLIIRTLDMPGRESIELKAVRLEFVK